MTRSLIATTEMKNWIKQGIGIANIPSLAVSAQTTVRVTLNNVFADKSYTAFGQIVSATIAHQNGIAVLSTTVVNTNQVDVVVRNTTAVTIASGARVAVHAFKP